MSFEFIGQTKSQQRTKCYQTWKICNIIGIKAFVFSNPKGPDWRQTLFKLIFSSLFLLFFLPHAELSESPFWWIFVHIHPLNRLSYFHPTLGVSLLLISICQGHVLMMECMHIQIRPQFILLKKELWIVSSVGIKQLTHHTSHWLTSIVILNTANQKTYHLCPPD